MARSWAWTINPPLPPPMIPALSGLSGIVVSGQILFLAGEGRVERGLVWSKIEIADEGAAFRCAMDAVHAAVLPFHGERSSVADIIQRHDDLFETNVAATDGAKTPETARIGEIRVAAEHTYGAIAMAPPDVFHVGVINAVAKFANEPDII